MRTLSEAIEDLRKGGEAMEGTDLGVQIDQQRTWLEELQKRRREDKLAQALFSGTPSIQPPYVKGSDTSKEAAESMKPKGPVLRAEVFKFLFNRGEQGATDEEVEHALTLRHQTASARRRELVLQGVVQDSGERRKTTSGRSAAVWKVVEKEKKNG